MKQNCANRLTATMGLCLFMLALALHFPLSAQEEGERCRGNYLRSDIETIKTEKRLSATLVITEDRQPTLKINCHIRETLQETKIYEMRLRKYTVTNQNYGGTYEYTVLKDEVWKEPPLPFTRERIAGLLANTPLSVDGKRSTTDANGCIPPEDMAILDRLDNLGSRTTTYTIATKDYPPIAYTVYRTIPQRQPNDDRLVDEPASRELLNIYKIDFHQSRKEPEQKGLVFSLEMPRDFVVATCGKPIPVKVTVTNNGSTDTSCLLGRSFSRIPGLNGKLFYFGTVPCGKSASFTRYLTVDSDNLTNDAYVEIRFSDSWSVIRDYLKIHFSVIH